MSIILSSLPGFQGKRNWSSHTSWWDYQIWSILKNSLAVPQKINIEISDNSSVSPLVLDKKKEKVMSTQNLYMNIHSFFHNRCKLEIAQIFVNSLMDKKIWYVHTMGYYSIRIRKGIMTYSETWINHEYMQSERSYHKRLHIVWVYFHEITRIGKAIGLR